jgi:hypothetical protein
VNQNADIDPDRRRSRMTAVLLGLVAVALYLPMIGWGLPEATAPHRTKTFAADEILPLEALAEMHNTFVVSKPDRNYGYPWWHYFVVAVAQAPYVAYLAATGELQGGQPDYPFGLRDPVHALRILTLIGRFVSVLMGAGVVVAAYFFSKILWGHATGVAAAVLTMLSYLMCYYGSTGNLDVPVFFWSACGLVVFAAIVVCGLTVRRGVWLGVLAGVATATKDQAVILFLPLGMALLFPAFHRSPGSSSPLRALLAGFGAAVAAYVLAAGMAVDPWRHVTHVHALFFDPSRVTAAGAYRVPAPKTWAGVVSLLHSFWHAAGSAFSMPVLLASFAGMWLAARETPRYLVFLLPVPALFVLLFLPTGLVVLRYLLPLTLILDAFAAHAALALRRSRWSRASIPVLVVLCAWRFAIAADLAYARQHDTRYGAASWLITHVQQGERVEFFGVAETLPPLPADIHTRRVAGRIQWVGEHGHGGRVLQYLAADGPEFLVIVPDWTSQPWMAHSADCPPEVYNALVDGTAGYTLVAYFPPQALLPASLQRPALDNPSVNPPVRIFARRDVAARVGEGG